jgi:hypothetical protein
MRVHRATPKAFLLEDKSSLDFNYVMPFTGLKVEAEAGFYAGWRVCEIAY